MWDEEDCKHINLQIFFFAIGENWQKFNLSASTYRVSSNLAHRGIWGVKIGWQFGKNMS